MESSGFWHRWRSRRWLRNIESIGARPRLLGCPDVRGDGDIRIGDDFFLSSRPVQSHIVTFPGAEIHIGHRVRISYGAAVAAARQIRIGDGTLIGPFVVIMDTDFHRPGDRDSSGDTAPVHIGSDVSIGARVTILRSTVIGDGATILSGSTVSGLVPGRATVGGVPARALAAGPTTDPTDVPDLICSVLGLAERPGPDQGPHDIPEWDSLGTLRLLLAIEETYGISVREDEVQSAKSVAALLDVVNRARDRASREVAGNVQS
jgi:acetyltransferase-like isoleucine patch superfamily enzyme/acyl carrier protein